MFCSKLLISNISIWNESYCEQLLFIKHKYHLFLFHFFFPSLPFLYAFISYSSFLSIYLFLHSYLHSSFPFHSFMGLWFPKTFVVLSNMKYKQCFLFYFLYNYNLYLQLSSNIWNLFYNYCNYKYVVKIFLMTFALQLYWQFIFTIHVYHAHLITHIDTHTHIIQKHTL